MRKFKKPFIALIFIIALLSFFSGVSAGESSDFPADASMQVVPIKESGSYEAEEVTNSSNIESTSWTRTFGGDSVDCGQYVRQTTDGGYISAGYTTSYGKGYQVFLIKIDANGAKQWQKTFGGDGDDVGHSVQQTSDGGYIMTGKTDSSGKGSQVYLIRTDADGKLQWKKSFGGYFNDEGYSVQQTDDGGYIVAGSTDSVYKGPQVYLIKTDANGTRQWKKTFGGDSWDYSYSVRQTTDDGYIIAGETNSFSKESQLYLIKTDINGTREWQKMFGGDNWARGHSVQQTRDGGYIIAGETYSFGKDSQLYLIKTNEKGKKQWQKIFDDNGYGYSVQQTRDGGYIVAGTTYTYCYTAYQVNLIKTDSNGVKTWQKMFGGSGDESGYSVQQTSDGGYIVAGAADSFGKDEQVYLIKTGPNG